MEAIYDDLKKQEEEKSYVINIEEDNIKLKKKIIALDKELNALLVKVEEKKMDLDSRLKDRHK